MVRERVDYWEKWGGEEWDTMAAVVRAFNCIQDAYEVVMTPAGDQSASPDLPRFLRAQHHGSPPDLIGLEDHQIADLAAQGALTPLVQVLDPLHVTRAGYDDRFLALGAFDNALYGVPVSANIVTLYINLASVRGTLFEAGHLPVGLGEFDAGIKELRVRGQVGFVPTYPGWWPHAWAWIFGASWVDPQGRFAPDQPDLVQAYEWFTSWRNHRAPGTFDGLINPIGAHTPDPFLSGAVAMVFDGDWLVPRLMRAPGLDWTPAAFPTTDQRPAALIVADLLSIPAGARCMDGAAAFLRFALQPAQIEHVALGHGKISPLAHWSAPFVARHRNPALGHLRTILESARIFHDPRTPGWLAQLGSIKHACAQMWAGQQTPEHALAAIVPKDAH